MTSETQKYLSEMKNELSDSMWSDSQNNWVKLIGPTKLGQIGKSLAQKTFGGTLLKNSEYGYDLISKDKKIVIKTATTTIANGYPFISWKQIRIKDDFTHICFIAIYPDNTRIFLVAKNELDQNSLTNMHRSSTVMDIAQISTRKIDTLFAWLTKCEVLAR